MYKDRFYGAVSRTLALSYNAYFKYRLPREKLVLVSVPIISRDFGVSGERGCELHCPAYLEARQGGAGDCRGVQLPSHSFVLIREKGDRWS